MTQQTNIPKDWQEVKLGELLDYEQPGKYIVKSEEYDDYNGIPVLTAGKSFILGYTNETDGIYVDVPIIIFDDFTRDTRYITFPFKVKSSAIKLLKLKNKGDNLKFLYEKLQMIDLEVTEHKRNWISAYQNLKILVPKNPAEQILIANILSDVDSTIQKTDELTKQTNKLKKGLMTDLLTKGIGHKKFKETELGKISVDWEIKPLSYFLTQNDRVVAKPDTNFKRLGIRSHCKGIFIDDEYDPAKTIMDELYVVKENDLIVNITFAWEGAIAIVTKDGNDALVSHRFPNYSFNLNKSTPDFFRYAMIQKDFLNKLVIISPGGAGRNRVMNKKDFLKIKIALPPLPEQHQISNILSTIDKEIETLKEKKEYYNKLKKGLMDDLLTGRVRVKV